MKLGSANIARFSTLYGSKWVATRRTHEESEVVNCFSTLYGSKWVATVQACRQTMQWLRFQYPLRVEVGCNSIGRLRATLSLEFQYPLRVEVGCNRVDRTLKTMIPRRFSTLYGSKWVATKGKS